MFLSKLKRVAETFGLACFVLLAAYGTLSLIRGDLVQAAGRTGSIALAQGQPTDPQGAPTEPQAVQLASFPITFNYQGTLRLADGSPANGSYTMSLSIYNTVIGGTPLYSETVQNVLVRDGLFTVLLGDQAGGPSISSSVFITMPRYLGVAVLPDAEMQPRQRIHPVPWAVNASTATTLVPGATINGGLNVLGGSVGIGTTSPGANARLNVVGGAILVGASPQTADAAIMVTSSFGGIDRLLQMSPTGASKPGLNLLASTNSSGNWQWWAWGVTTDNKFRIQPGGTFSGDAGLSIDPSGNVGIGNGGISVKVLASTHMGGLSYPNCYDTGVYGFVYKIVWDPGGMAGQTTTIRVISSVSEITALGYGDWGVTTVGPNHIQVCVTGGSKAVVDGITVYYIPFAGYE